MNERKIFVLDDEADLVDALAGILSMTYTVKAFTDPTLALAALADTPDVHAVLCDLNFPGFDGRRVYETLLEQGWPARQRFIVMTGGSAHYEGSAFFKQEGVPVLEKPFRIEELIRVLETRGA